MIQNESYEQADKNILEKITPKKRLVYIKDQVDVKDQSWHNKKQDAYMATKNFLAQLEEEQLEKSRKYYPLGLQTTKILEREKEEAKAAEEEDRVISKTDQLLEILEKGQAEFEKQFGE